VDIGMAPRSRVLAIGAGLSQQGNRGAISPPSSSYSGPVVPTSLASSRGSYSRTPSGYSAGIASKTSCPAIHQFHAVVEPGCPASYAVGCSPPTPPRVLKDAKLANLPVEQRTDEMIE
jgi:hypothetical protein